MNLNGDGSKLIWNTEYGLPTSVVSEATQAAFVQDLLNTWSGLTGVGPMFFYTTRDREANSYDSEDNFGLFNNNWTPKKVVQVIEDVDRGAPRSSDSDRSDRPDRSDRSDDTHGSAGRVRRPGRGCPQRVASSPGGRAEPEGRREPRR